MPAAAPGTTTPMLDLPPPPPAQTLSEHARFVLAAEFDIDSGATIRHQFPYPVTPSGSHFLAELMLPDGAHLHKNDTTVFYLNQVQGNMVSDGILSEDEPSSEDDLDASALRPAARRSSVDRKEVLYVLNCVSLKENQAVRRGAEVKALAVCFPHPFIQAYKPLIILALQHYFTSPSVHVLSQLYDAINAIDTTGMPRFSKWEKWVLRATDRRDLFVEVFHDPKWKRDSSSGDTQSVRRGSSPAAQSSDAESPGLELDLGKVLNGGSLSASLSTSSSLSSLALASPPPPTPPPKGAQPSLDLLPDQQRPRIGSTTSYKQGFFFPSLHGDGADKQQRDTHVFETSARLEGTTLPMSIPLTTFHEEVGEFSLKELIRKFSPSPSPLFPGPFIPSLHTSGAATPPIILLLNALLTSRRVLFLGHNKPAGDVAAYVLAACALASGSGAVLRGFASRAFPYTNLMGLDVLEQVEEAGEGGWIAGVTNPRFEDLTSRWDVLCNIDTGRITVSRECKGERVDGRAVEDAKSSEVSLARSGEDVGEFGGIDSASISGGGTVRGKGGRSDSVGSSRFGLGGDQDTAFMEEINLLIDRHYGEAIIRARMAEYLLHFIRLTARFEEETYPSLASTSRIWYPAVACDPSQGRLGSGAILSDDNELPSSEGGSAAAAAAGEKKRRESDLTGSNALEGRKTVAEWVGTAGVKRIEAWRKTQSCEFWKEDFAEYTRTTTLPFDLSHQLARLRSARPIPEGEAVLIFRALASEVRTYDHVVEVLAHTPANRGGLTPFGFGLFHPNNEVKASTVDFFDTLQQYPIGVAFLMGLNGFHRLAYKRLSDERTEAVRSHIDQERRTLGFVHQAAEQHATSGERAIGLGMNGAGL